MAVIITKELILVEDFEFGFDASTQDRGGNQFNAAYLPYSVLESVKEALDARYTGLYLEDNFAAIDGSPTELFNVLSGTIGTEAVNYSQLDIKEDRTVVALKADKANVLELDNQDLYGPINDYNPATKKFVDDSIFTAFQSGVSGSFESADGKTITVTNGLVTGII